MIGSYMIKAICHILPKGNSYPEKPIHMFEGDGMDNITEIDDKHKQKLAEKDSALITAQMIKVQSYFKKQ